MFAEVRFPEDISFGASGGPEFVTDVVTLASGAERRNRQRQTGLARYNIAHGVKSKTQLDALIAFFRARKGRAEGFRFKDWMDFSATNQPLGTGDGAATAFQLIKTYGAQADARVITKPVAGSVQVYVDSVPAEDAAVDAATGKVELATPPAAGQLVHVNFEFDVPVRFDTDHLSARMEEYGVYSWLDIPLVEIGGQEA